MSRDAIDILNGFSTPLLPLMDGLASGEWENTCWRSVGPKATGLTGFRAVDRDGTKTNAMGVVGGWPRALGADAEVFVFWLVGWIPFRRNSYA